MKERNFPGGNNRSKLVTSFIKAPPALLSKAELKTRSSLSASRASGSESLVTAFLRRQISPFHPLSCTSQEGLRTQGMPRMRKHNTGNPGLRGGDQIWGKRILSPTFMPIIPNFIKLLSTSIQTPTLVWTWGQTGFFQSLSFFYDTFTPPAQSQG